MKHKGLIIGLILGAIYCGLYIALSAYTAITFENKYFLLFFFFFGLLLEVHWGILLGASALVFGLVGFLFDNYKGTGLPLLLAIALIFISLFFLIFSNRDVTIVIWLIPAIILICFLLALVLKKEDKHE